MNNPKSTTEHTNMESFIPEVPASKDARGFRSPESDVIGAPKVSKEDIQMSQGLSENRAADGALIDKTFLINGKVVTLSKSEIDYILSQN